MSGIKSHYRMIEEEMIRTGFLENASIDATDADQKTDQGPYSDLTSSYVSTGEMFALSFPY